MDFAFFNRLLSGLRACHPGVTANQVQMFLVIAENPGITATEIAKRLTLPGERFVTVSSVARGLDVLGSGRRQRDKENNPANLTQMGVIRWNTDARGRRSGFFLSSLGEDLLEDARCPKLEMVAA